MAIRLKRSLKKFVQAYGLDIFIYRAAVRWPVLADIYYVFSGAFRREHRAVLYGKLQHTADVKRSDAEGAEYTLRRNTHRLEKGIISRPRRDVFARDYLANTVRIYLSLSESPSNRLKPLLKWSHDVLAEYFSIVASDAAIDPYRKLFEEHQPRFDCEADENTWAPYERDQSPLNISIDDLSALAWRRRSVRWYQNKSVPRDIIDRAIEVAKLSPSACNRQPFEFRIIDDPEIAKQVGAIPSGTGGFSQNFVCLIVIVGDLRAYFSERDRHVIYVDGGLAAMALQFALEVQGVSSCCINWPDIENREQQMDKALGLPPNQRPIMCMSVGYADPTGAVPYSQKKSLDQIRSYNRHDLNELGDT